MSFEPMRQSTSLYEKISEALEPIFLTQDEFEKLSDAIQSYQEEEDDDEDIDLQDVLEKLEHIVLTEQEDY
jgi:FtsZ-binding cell division protein ZapB